MIDEDFLRNPYPAYQALRSGPSLSWNDEFCGGAWLVHRYADVASVLRDPRFSVRRAGGWANSSGPGAEGELREFKRIFSRSLLFVDPPQHTRLRQAMAGGFKPAALQSWAPRIELLVDELLAPIEARLRAKPEAEFDLMRDFARPLPARVIALMLGVDGADCADFVAWSDDIAAFIGSPTPTIEIARAAQVSLVAMNEYFRHLLAQRRLYPGLDLMSDLIRAEASGGIVTSKELLAQCCTLLFAGHETTRNLLGNGVLALLQHRPQWDALVLEDTGLPLALKELLRYDSPVQYSGRRLRVDVEMHGQQMKKGQLVIALIGAANHDPIKFSDPARLDTARNEGAHLSFGFGPHVCIGATLTYMEAEIALRKLLHRLPALELARDQQRWGRNAVYRALEELPLRIPAQTSVRKLATVF